MKWRPGGCNTYHMAATSLVRFLLGTCVRVIRPLSLSKYVITKKMSKNDLKNTQ